MRIIIYPEPGQEGEKFYQSMPNDWQLAHHYLRDELTQAGYDVSVWPCEVDKQKDIGLCFDFPKYPCNIPDTSMCVMLEPPVVFPQQYAKMNGLPFKRILTFARDFCDDRRVFWEPYPVVRYDGPLAERRDKGICAISGGGKDFGSVTINGKEYPSFYNARRLAYLSYQKDLDLYGFGWGEDVEMHRAVNVKGAIVGHKVPVMSQYREAIVFENCYCEGYASEKQYDAYTAGVNLHFRGWRPDYEWEYAESEQWARRIAAHVRAII